MKSAHVAALAAAFFSCYGQFDSFARDADANVMRIISGYVSTRHKWKPTEYRIEPHGSERGLDVYWVIWLAEEHSIIPGGGKSFEVFYDRKTHRITQELGFE